MDLHRCGTYEKRVTSFVGVARTSIRVLLQMFAINHSSTRVYARLSIQ